MPLVGHSTLVQDNDGHPLEERAAASPDPLETGHIGTSSGLPIDSMFPLVPRLLVLFDLVDQRLSVNLLWVPAPLHVTDHSSIAAFADVLDRFN
eukprot:80051-Hanusia_phi.AAC.1